MVSHRHDVITKYVLNVEWGLLFNNPKSNFIHMLS